jgi:D-alanyl-D-alanine carboxypeptidase (penicillin-binding protein 5/6)
MPFNLFAVAIATIAALSTGDIGARAQSTDTAAEFAILMDADTGAILFEKNAAVPTAPASMSKLMTLYMVFERLRDGSLTLEDTFPVSEKAWRMGGSKMFVGVNTRIKIDDLLHGIIVQSGNDACIVVAEGLASSEEAFAEAMTRRARDMGLTASTFRNSTGWPDPEHLMSVRDIALLSRRIIREFPQFYSYFHQTEFTYNGIRQGNRNPLLYGYNGADGLKTGHTEQSGYGLAASAVRGDRRLILVVNGLESVNARAQETERLLDWGFREFGNYALFMAGETVESAPVWLGREATVPMIVDRDIKLTLARRARRDLRVSLAYTTPIAAPVVAGQPIAEMRIEAPGAAPLDVPLVAANGVDRLGTFGRLSAAFKYLLWGGAQ